MNTTYEQQVMEQIPHLGRVGSKPLHAQQRPTNVLGEHHRVRSSDLLGEFSRNYCMRQMVS